MADTNKLVEIDHVKAKLMELMAEFFGVDPAYYNIDSSGLADHLIAHGVTVVQASNPIDSDGVNRWIPVSDRLPKVGMRVIVCRDEGKVEQGIFLGASGFWKVFGANTKKVTHWQPLPEPPKGE